MSEEAKKRRQLMKYLGLGSALGLAGCLGGGDGGGGSDGTSGDGGGGSDGTSGDGNGSDGGDGGGQQTVTGEMEYLSWGLEFMEDTVNDWVSDFQDQYGAQYGNPEIKVTFRGPDTESMVSYFQSGLQSGDPVNAMDTQMMTYMQYAEDDVWVDHEKFDGSDGYLDKFYDSVINLGRYNGTLLQLPFYHNTNLTYYRNQWFNDAGIEAPRADDPWTTDEYLDNAVTIVDETDAEFGLTTLTFGWRGWPFFYSEGINMLNEDGSEAAFNTDRTAEILGRFRNLTDDGVIPDVTWTGTWEPQAQQFGGGNTGMYFSNGAALRLVSNFGSDWVSKDTMNIFTAPENERYGGILLGHWHGIVKTEISEPQQKASFDLLRVITDKKWQKDFLRKTTVLVPHKEALQELSNDAQYKKENPMLVRQYNQFGEVSDKLAVPPKVPGAGQVWSIFRSNWQAAALGEKSVEKALNDAEQRINNELQG